MYKGKAQTPILLTKAQAVACGVGGLDLPDVHASVVQHLADLPFPIYIYTTYQKGQPTSEPYVQGPTAEGVHS